MKTKNEAKQDALRNIMNTVRRRRDFCDAQLAEKENGGDYIVARCRLPQQSATRCIIIDVLVDADGPLLRLCGLGIGELVDGIHRAAFCAWLSKKLAIGIFMIDKDRHVHFVAHQLLSTLTRAEETLNRCIDRTLFAYTLSLCVPVLIPLSSDLSRN